jgi:transcription antitermination protein NusB
MANRHLSRSVVLQTLFEWDFMKLSHEAASEALSRNIAEFATGMGDEVFMKNLAEGVVAKQTDLDKIITKAAPEWPLEKISNVDRNVLRLGLYELLFSARNEVPPKVAINEAIELAKTYGGENSGKFVNGVLGAVYKEIGEPGKEEVSKRKKIEDIPFEQMPIQNLVGAVIYAFNEGEMYLALVHDVFGHWTLSKGKVRPEEELKAAVVRKAKEETGLDVEVEDELGNNEYVASDPELGKIRKQVHYFLARAEYGELHLEKKGGLDDASWFKMSEIVDLNLYNDIVPIFTKAVNILLAKKA